MHHVAPQFVANAVRAVMLAMLASLTASVFADDQSAAAVPFDEPIVSLETEGYSDQFGTTQSVAGTSAVAPGTHDFSPEKLRQLMRPNFSFASEWQAETNDLQLSTLEAGLSIPTYPIFGPPPPFVNLGFVYTNLDSPAAFALPNDLYEARMGIAWIRRINERWTVRLMAGTSFATDRLNTSSDAWQFRGGVFGIYQRNPKWTWTFGAIALGRNDLPVLPAVGVIYQPHSNVRIDLLMPRPRVSLLVADNGARQQWIYLGAGLNGTTWGVQRNDGSDDQLTYGDVRFVVGWESTPTREPGVPFTRGRKMSVEAGYVFSRDFEWESDGAKIRLDDTFMLRGSISF